MTRPFGSLVLVGVPHHGASVVSLDPPQRVGGGHRGDRGQPFRSVRGGVDPAHRILCGYNAAVDVVGAECVNEFCWRAVPGYAGGAAVGGYGVEIVVGVVVERQSATEQRRGGVAGAMGPALNLPRVVPVQGGVPGVLGQQANLVAVPVAPGRVDLAVVDRPDRQAGRRHEVGGGQRVPFGAAVERLLRLGPPDPDDIAVLDPALERLAEPWPANGADHLGASTRQQADLEDQAGEVVVVGTLLPA